MRGRASPTRGYPLATCRPPDTSRWRAPTGRFNAEIYNFMEIRRELEVAGYRFRSRSDTEVIVNGWLAWATKIFSGCTACSHW